MSDLSEEAIRYALSYAAREAVIYCAVQGGDIAIALMDEEQHGDFSLISSEYFGERDSSDEEWDELIFDLRNIWDEYDVDTDAPMVYYAELNDDKTMPATDEPEWLSRFSHRYNTAVRQLSILEAI